MKPSLKEKIELDLCSSTFIEIRGIIKRLMIENELSIKNKFSDELTEKLMRIYKLADAVHFVPEVLANEREIDSKAWITTLKKNDIFITDLYLNLKDK
jgi:hypothetical protein